MPQNSSKVSPEALALALKINKELGEDALVIASQMVVPKQITSGSLSLDIALGGGWPGNQFIEIRGAESNGKTMCVYKTVAANQQIDPEFTTFWVASEHYDREQAEALGVDNDRVIVLSTQDMAVAFEAVDQYARSRTVDCIVIDSYPALIAPEEEQKGMEDVQVAAGARIMGKFLRKLGSATRRRSDGSERPVYVFMINQLRDLIGGFSPYGTPTTTPGGKAKNYVAYVQLDVKRVEFIEEKVPGVDGKVKVGQVTKFITVKNKQAPPRQVATVDFYFRDTVTLGFKRGEYDHFKEAVTIGVIYDLIQRRGAYFTYGEDRWQGKDAMIQAFKERPDIYERLNREIREIAIHGKGSLLEAQEVEAAENIGEKKVRRSPKNVEEVA